MLSKEYEKKSGKRFFPSLLKSLGEQRRKTLINRNTASRQNDNLYLIQIKVSAIEHQ